MIYFIKEILSDLLNGDWLEKLVSLFFILAFLLITWLVYWMSFNFIDQYGVKDKEDQGTVVSKYYKPAYTSMIMMPVGKVMIPQYINHPESWNVNVITNNDIVLKCPCTEKQFNSIETNNKEMMSLY